MCTWILICANFVPISLLVTLEMVKVFQANFIESDEYLIDDEHKILTHVQSSNLNEELGQVNFIFSDKTGTLTRNEMIFQKFYAGKNQYDTTGSTAIPKPEISK